MHSPSESIGKNLPIIHIFLTLEIKKFGSIIGVFVSSHRSKHTYSIPLESRRINFPETDCEIKATAQKPYIVNGLNIIFK
jgi:hypothetical protein